MNKVSLVLLKQCLLNKMSKIMSFALEVYCKNKQHAVIIPGTAHMKRPSATLCYKHLPLSAGCKCSSFHYTVISYLDEFPERERTFHTRTAPSKLHEATHSLSRLHESPNTVCVCPFSSKSTVPAAKSQTLTRLSSPKFKPTRWKPNCRK